MKQKIVIKPESVVLLGLLVVVLIAAMLVDTSVDVHGSDGFSEERYVRVQVSQEECRDALGYMDCGGGYIFIERETLAANRNWCHVAWSGLPDQYRAGTWDDLPDHIRSVMDEDSFPDAEAERVISWRRYSKTDIAREWVFWSDWETEEQREWRLNNGWKSCEDLPRDPK